ncbi:hypothetical protein BO221_28210 [Archangium sp. Cb G35]|uniref:hypothetical protein n=1 Tax=Archangium sp. Cb G35 TaxID=1920190 RepID=UPI00093730AA|nr:hypothetical protein [Archangium sp. Cb G35]OJT20798.1 hypothetical protein BO221_28210 [Archangium sp. Cb G35]
MKKECGSNLWWLDDTKLVIQRQRKPVDILKGVFALAMSAVLGWISRSVVDIQAVLFMLFGIGYGLYCTLGVWEVTLHRTSGRAFWRWGLGVPFFSQQSRVTDTDHVQLVTAQSGDSSDSSINKYSVRLPSGTLAGTDDYEEALALAEAVARHMRMGLQVDDGRMRSPLDSPALAETPPVEPPSAPPPGCLIQVRAHGEQRVVELPAPGWLDAYRFQAGVCVVLMLIPLGFAGYLYSLDSSWKVVGMVSPILLLLTGFGAFLLRATLTGVHTSWRISVSRRGLRVESTRAGKRPATQRAAGLIRDIDVREQMADSLRVGISRRPTIPMLVIEWQNGTRLSLGEGFSREELEWTASRIRQELASLTGEKNRELKAG